MTRPPPSPRDRLVEMINRALLVLCYLALHVVVALFFILTVKFFELAAIGVGDPKVAEALPWRYLFDVIDLGIIVVFAWSSIAHAIRIMGE